MSRFTKSNLAHVTPVRASAAAALFGAALVLTSCSTASRPNNDLAADQQILATCDAAAPPAADIQIDGSGSSSSDAITEERFKAIESVVRTTAICSGRLRVSVFSSSSAATNIIIDKPLHLDGATDNARLKRLPTLVTDTMTAIRSGYSATASSLPNGGSDISAEYRLANEWIGQVGAPYRLHLYLLTDGFQNVGFRLDDKVISKQEAADLASGVAVPQLPGASVLVAGLGRISGAPPSSEMVDGLIAFYDALCKKASAAQCVSVTDYTVAGR
ncbi:hypothetical protein ABZ342_32835 [Amycolatopsis sp. NPDC005961]|uniref:hypothetical protein n=1 Tax=Amycolatopsis sp. NPDC005961 TaxID=3156720 RepID=UPI0033D06C1C